MASAASALRTPNTIWSKVIETNAAATKKTERGDSFLFFVGSRGSGKSTLLNRFLYPDRAELPKPSEGLEYTFARKPAQYDHEKKDLAHIWEVGGSQELATEIVQEEHIFLTFKQVTTAVAVIVVDLSDPSTVCSTIQHWIDQVKRKLASTYEKFEKRGLQLPEQLRTRAKLKLFNGHEDKDLVYHSGVSLVIVGAKYDTFQDQDPECKKLMAKALRYIAHANGAHLVYTGALQGSSAGGPGGTATSKASASSEKQMMDNFRMLLNHLAFNGIERKLPDRLKVQADHMGPLFIPAGQDHFRDIGRPRGSSGITDAGALADGLREWQELLERTFPPKAGKAAAKGKYEVPDQYREEDVDTALREKMAELELYRRQQAEAAEAKKRAAASRPAQPGAAAGAQQAAGGAPAAGKVKKKAPSGAKPAAAAR